MKQKTKKKAKKQPHWTEYKKIPYEDYQHMTSITTKDYTKGIFKQKQAHMIKNGYLILYPHKGVNIENILYFWCEVLWPAVKFDLMGSVSKDYTKGIFKETGI